ncbi:hypothetical protein [Streptoalloteichus tenebrarius]|uniref:hypothetical protein n=1 Tax=Streptoalloteichus tenebrarius (strain ATCC 17920 / DSM 40477 / JCM 4838 / CBS 697.72 / NBRC 16177 / NCIMB 11028 / NRRL B-12390 / A12253. 1 / ISP 5477) TaxID=1933 RepID=UPI0020A5704A|nr:hypothetical protein [Streptoalloteichus tenebrarius]
MWERIHASGLPYHPAYHHIPRLSCSFCVLARPRDLVRAAQLRPDLAQRYADVEARINHRFHTDLSVAKIIHRTRMALDPGPALPAPLWTPPCR